MQKHNEIKNQTQNQSYVQTTKNTQGAPLSELKTTLGLSTEAPEPQAQGVSVGNPKLISAYGLKRKTTITFPKEGRTRQEFKAESDINNIMARYQKTGLMENSREAIAQYLDCTQFDFQTAHNFIAGATSMFEGLPSSIRSRFDNDPSLFLGYMEDERNHKEARELGLLPREEPQATPLAGEPTQATGGANPPNVAPIKQAEAGTPAAAKAA
ncbi:MAG: internal scaffolding protein [Microvirus sp.]|nr:MAG: internal scaffolding protein [Microvirus sp.]